MKIFLPFKKDLNPYLDELEYYSSFQFVYSGYNKYNKEYRIVNIHWPEAIFDWLEPSTAQLNMLEKEIQRWKENSKIVYTLHDERRHKGMTSNFSRLFQLIETNADLFIHLGKFSREKYEKKYPKAKHKVVFHPLFENSYPNFDKDFARQKLGIDKKAKVFIVPGQIRNKQEKNLILKAFKKLDVETKVLLAPRMRNEMEFDFRGRIRLKKYFDIQKLFLNRFRQKYQPPTYYFKYKRATEVELSIYMSATDVVIIPRINTLNSGILFLGMTFDKIVVGPGIGNIKEHLIKLDYPVFDPNSTKSLIEALKKAINLYNAGFNIENSLKQEYRPAYLSRQVDKLFMELTE